MGQVVGIEAKAGTTDRNAWPRLSCLTVLAVLLASVVACERFKVSSRHGPLPAALSQIHEHA
jgi:hypothetical protein